MCTGIIIVYTLTWLNVELIHNSCMFKMAKAIFSKFIIKNKIDTFIYFMFK